jgi:broad specificity phosphatase PhoE
VITTRLSPLLGLFFSALAVVPGFGRDRDDSLVVFLVRHAEKLEAEADPDLSTKGRGRAQVLASTLQSAGITHVHSSDYKRTRNTAGAVSRELGLKTKIYDPRELPSLVTQLKNMGGRHLVVGHSNTTPALARLLGGVPGSAIDEKREFDRLYVITIDQSGKASTVLLRYGVSFAKGR